MKQNFKDKNETELEKILEEKTSALKNFRFGIAGSRVKNVREARILRRNIARVLTELNKK